jgi:hypothetical protein
MNELTDYNSLKKYFDNETFVIKTQQQIVKDFAKLNLFFSSNFENQALSKDEIELQIGQQLVELMKEGETRLLQLLYTIDLSEKEFLRLTTEANFIEELSKKILFREAYKIYLRIKFSSTPNIKDEN